MDILRYPAVIEANDYGCSVFFPDLMGCTSGADTLDETIDQAAVALCLHLAGMTEDKQPIPPPTSFDRIVLDQDIQPHAIVLIEARQTSVKARINIMMDTKLIEKIDKVAANRSAFISQAARAALADM